MHLQPSAITYEEFRRRARAAGCRALSANYRPRQAEAASIFTTSLGQLLSDNTYSVHSSNAALTAFINYNDPNARALRVDEMVGAAPLLEQVLAEVAEFAKCQLTEANVLSLRCSGCGRRIIVDGVHRLARLAAEKQFEALVHVVELSGRSWPPETPNFNIVCVCPKE